MEHRNSVRSLRMVRLAPERHQHPPDVSGRLDRLPHISDEPKDHQDQVIPASRPDYPATSRPHVVRY